MLRRILVLLCSSFLFVAPCDALVEHDCGDYGDYNADKSDDEYAQCIVTLLCCLLLGLLYCRSDSSDPDVPLLLMFCDIPLFTVYIVFTGFFSLCFSFNFILVFRVFLFRRF